MKQSTLSCVYEASWRCSLPASWLAWPHPSTSSESSSTCRSSKVDVKRTTSSNNSTTVHTFYVQNWSMRLVSGMAIVLSEMPWPLDVSRQPLPAPSFAPPFVHLRRTCLNNLTGRHYADAENCPAWPSFINFHWLVFPYLTLCLFPFASTLSGRSMRKAHPSQSTYQQIHQLIFLPVPSLEHSPSSYSEHHM